MFGSDLYYISFLGKPSTTQPWMLQFGGHHLALNITIAGNRGVMTPSLTGAQPATFKVDGQTIRPLGTESDKASALLQTLDANQRQQAILDYRVADLVLGPGQDGKKIAPEGLKVSAMNDKQRAMLLDLIAEWAGIMNESAAAVRMAQLKADSPSLEFIHNLPTMKRNARAQIGELARSSRHLQSKIGLTDVSIQDLCRILIVHLAEIQNVLLGDLGAGRVQ
jgi:hypothetical protein